MKNVQQSSDLLGAINSELAARSLKPIAKLGKSSKGEIEILRILEIYEHSARFFTDVKFEVMFPGGALGQFTVRFNANGASSDGAVIVSVVNDRIAIVKQWRLPLSKWTYELPRGFAGDKLEQASRNQQFAALSFADLPLATLVRELGPELMKDASIKALSQLGCIAENSGTSNVSPNYFLVQIEVEQTLFSQKVNGSDDQLKVYFWSWEQVQAELGKRICDNHSIVGLSLAMPSLVGL